MVSPMTERSRRGWLVGLGLCWAVLAIANFGVTEIQRFQPKVTGALCVGAALATITLAVKPDQTLAYRFGGTLGVGALLFRLTSVVLGMIRAPHEEIVPTADMVFVSMASLATTAMLVVFWWHWWLIDVKDWHECHKRLEP